MFFILLDGHYTTMLMVDPSYISYPNTLLSIGFVVGLDYKNPYLNPYEEFPKI